MIQDQERAYMEHGWRTKGMAERFVSGSNLADYRVKGAHVPEDVSIESSFTGQEFHKRRMRAFAEQ